MRGFTSAALVATSTPRTIAWPPSGARSPSRISTVVVLPAPFGPSRPKISPAATWKSIPSTATMSPYRLISPRTSTTGSVATERVAAIGGWYKRGTRRRRRSLARGVEPPTPVDVERDQGVLGRRRPEREVRIERGLEADVTPLRLGQQPLLFEHVAIGLDRVAAGSDDGSEDGDDGLEDLLEPAVGSIGWVDRRATLGLEPCLVLPQVVQQETRLTFERDEPCSSCELACVEPPAGDGHAQVDGLARLGRRQADLVDGEAEIVQASDACTNGLAVAG